MGHDVHFLSRLDRLRPELRELAMRLYQSPPVVRLLLDAAELPDDQRRVALSLGENGAGPYVVVERDGHFVTCLAEEMRVGDLPVIPRTKLEALVERQLREEEKREAEEAARREIGAEGVALYAQLYSAGPRLSREEFVILRAAVEADAALAIRLYLHFLDGLTRGRKVLARRNVPDESWAVFARALAEGTFGLASLSAALVNSPFLDPDALPDGGGPEARRFRERFFYLPFEVESGHAAAIGVCNAARAGHRTLTAVKRGVLEGEPGYRERRALLLAAAAVAHPKHRAEIRKVLERGTLANKELVLSLCELPVAPPSPELITLLLDQVREAGHPVPEVAFTHAREPDLAVAALARVLPDPRTRGDSELMICALPFLASVPVEQMFLPARRLAEWPAVSMETLGQRLFDAWYARNRVTTFRHEKPPPGRNDPCHCGSARKFKKCCGLAA